MAKPNLLNSIQMVKPGKNRFDLSHDVKLSCNMGQLVPIMALECVPGDSFQISCESLLRFAPLVAPMMHRVDVTMHYFFCPNRLNWVNWEKFITNTALESTGELPAFPTIALSNATSTLTKLTDYMGIPGIEQLDAGTVTVNAMAFAAYQRIFNEYYRDQNLMDAVSCDLVDGSNAAIVNDLVALRYRAWEHDYFTAALPFAQKGAAVDLPLGVVTLKDDWSDEPGNPRFVADPDVTGTGAITGTASGGGGINTASTATAMVAYDPAGTLEVGATTINDLRRAMRLQEWLEKNARGGTRYIENILVHFGVRSSDKRLNRPEYITGSKTPVTISEVVNTTGTEDAPQGNLAGHGVAVTTGKYGKYFCEEHGYIIGVMSILPKPAYQQGIPKHFLKYTDPFQYYWPSFAHIGEQEIVQGEIFALGNSDDLDVVFGYTPRYAEYKFMFNRVAGEFRTSLDFWHMGRKFAASPALNAGFVTADPTFRVFAVTDSAVDHMWCHVYNKVSAVRPMPKFGTPNF